MILLAMTALCAASCTEEVERLNDCDSALLRVTASVENDTQTRAQMDDTNFSENDRIGLFLTGYDGMYRNVMAMGKGDGNSTDVKSWSLDRDILLTSESTQVAAYYPYRQIDYHVDDKYSDIYFIVDIEEQINYLRGYAKEVSASHPEANIKFHHAMARLRLQVSYPDKEARLHEIRITGIPRYGNLFLNSGKVTDLDGDGMTLYAEKTPPYDNDGIKDVLLLPSAATTASVSLTFSDGKTYTTSVNLPAMSSGDYHILPISIKEGGQPIVGEHEYVDLGLPSGTLWATCNVGAQNPEDYGDFYAWGETETKDTYDWSTYKWCNGSENTMTKYCTDSSYGTVDNKTILDSEDDVAYVKWGGKWRMPTKANLDELLTECTWTWTQQNGVDGYTVSSNQSGNTNNIFLPIQTQHSSDGSVDYWSSSLYDNYPFGAFSVIFLPHSVVCWFGDERYHGNCVRPVYDDKTKHEYVDLGLSVKWATCNVGATSPEDYGDYFAWGETETKDTYDWSTYKWCNGSNGTMTKYCTDSSYGTVDNKTILNAEDDVAHVKRGGNWRMPTDAEQDELRTECNWEWTQLNGVNGYKVSSKQQGNANNIFLPAAGWCSVGEFKYVGSFGFYWSSTLYPVHDDSAYFLDFGSSYCYWSYDYRLRGMSVRAVCP